MNNEWIPVLRSTRVVAEAWPERIEQWIHLGGVTFTATGSTNQIKPTTTVEAEPADPPDHGFWKRK